MNFGVGHSFATLQFGIVTPASGFLFAQLRDRTGIVMMGQPEGQSGG